MEKRRYNQGVKYWNTEIMEHPDLTLQESAVMNLVLNLCWKSGETKAENSYFNKTLKYNGKSVKNVSNMIGRVMTSLENKGFITRESGNFNPHLGKQERTIRPVLDKLPIGYSFYEAKVIPIGKKR